MMLAKRFALIASAAFVFASCSNINQENNDLKSGANCIITIAQNESEASSRMVVPSDSGISSVSKWELSTVSGGAAPVVYELVQKGNSLSATIPAGIYDAVSIAGTSDKSSVKYYGCLDGVEIHGDIANELKFVVFRQFSENCFGSVSYEVALDDSWNIPAGAKLTGKMTVSAVQCPDGDISKEEISATVQNSGSVRILTFSADSVPNGIFETFGTIEIAADGTAESYSIKFPDRYLVVDGQSITSCSFTLPYSADLGSARELYATTVRNSDADFNGLFQSSPVYYEALPEKIRGLNEKITLVKIFCKGDPQYSAGVSFDAGRNVDFYVYDSEKEKYEIKYRIRNNAVEIVGEDASVPENEKRTKEITPSNWQEIKDGIYNATEEGYTDITVRLPESLEVDASNGVTVNVSKNIQLVPKDGIENCTISINNSSNAYLFNVENGGSLSIGNTTDKTSLIKIDCLFDKSQVTSENPLINVADAESSLDLYNVSVCNMKSKTSGAVVRTNGKTSVTECCFEGNEALSGSGGDSSGGAIYATASLFVKNTQFISNSASGSGGAVYAAYSVQLSGCTFKSNSTAGTGNGGALAVEGADALMSDFGSTFESNSTQQNGGAVYLNNAETPSLKSALIGTRFVKNTSSVDGGAVSVNAAATFTSCIFNENEPGNAGTVNICESGDVTLDSCTFAGNYAYGSANGSNGVQLADSEYASLTIKNKVTEYTSSASNSNEFNFYVLYNNANHSPHLKLDNFSLNESGMKIKVFAGTLERNLENFEDNENEEIFELRNS